MNHEKLLEVLISEPDDWLWNPAVDHEIMKLLPDLWDVISDQQREELEAVLLEGPSMGGHFSDWGPDKRDWTTWMRLSALEKAKHPVTGALEELMKELKARHPGWKKVESEQDYFLIWIGEHPTYSDEKHAEPDLCNREPEELLKILQQKHPADDYLRAWEGCVMGEPESGLKMIEHMVHRDTIDEDILTHTFRGLAEHLEPSPDNISRLKSAATRIPTPNWGAAIIAFMRMVRRFSEESEASPSTNSRLETEDIIELLEIGRAPAVEYPFQPDGDTLNRATNHPVGYAIDALLHRLSQDQGMTEGTGSFFKALLCADQVADGCTPAEVYLAFNLSRLHSISPDWTEANIIPLLDWDKPEKAREAWAAFLMSPRINDSLWEALQDHFVDACKNYDEIPVRNEQLAGMLTHVYLFGLPLEEPAISRCIEQFDNRGRALLLRYVAQFSEGAEEKADQLWEEKLIRFFSSLWPGSIKISEPDQRVSIIRAVISATDAFQDAVDAVEPLLQTSPCPREEVRWISKDKSNHAERHPAAILKLLDALLSRDAKMKGTKLEKVLRQIPADDSYRARFDRLKQLAQRV